MSSGLPETAAVPSGHGSTRRRRPTSLARRIGAGVLLILVATILAYSFFATGITKALLTESASRDASEAWIRASEQLTVPSPGGGDDGDGHDVGDVALVVEPGVADEVLAVLSGDVLPARARGQLLPPRAGVPRLVPEQLPLQREDHVEVTPGQRPDGHAHGVPFDGSRTSERRTGVGEVADFGAPGSWASGRRR